MVIPLTSYDNIKDASLHLSKISAFKQPDISDSQRVPYKKENYK